VVPPRLLAHLPDRARRACDHAHRDVEGARDARRHAGCAGESVPGLTVVWNPLAVGEPAIPGNGFRDYFPGLRFFDAYGND
jgi:hypothetical protein